MAGKSDSSVMAIVFDVSDRGPKSAALIKPKVGLAREHSVGLYRWGVAERQRG
jgi:inactivated superfamily I helicase